MQCSATAGIPPAQQCLVWHCKLENGRTLADCNIKDKSTVRLRWGGRANIPMTGTGGLALLLLGGGFSQLV